MQGSEQHGQDAPMQGSKQHGQDAPMQNSEQHGQDAPMQGSEQQEGLQESVYGVIRWEPDFSFPGCDLGCLTLLSLGLCLCQAGLIVMCVSQGYSEDKCDHVCKAFTKVPGTQERLSTGQLIVLITQDATSPSRCVLFLNSRAAEGKQW